ncbi:Oidioi.mRNA.OKI2018_I69.XSR.g15487.t1.cds [Oikopleura dioica]|uniref:Oidioi.mRNA.OKI2018_I69.XSR.g15487.t1.cds n=1 Tax=Oikopleura dioica TaxID=34765 RepID=A0ABN7SDK5_OIKDI|nr:Oidioi.mRNA.OKI2018_I69.XSR.g15487.t1.cds [Oikopleura dioica]
MDVGGLFVTWVNILKSLKHANVGSIVVSIICISILVPIKWASRKYKEKLRGFPIPGELLLIVIFAISQTFAPEWGSLGKIPEVGEIPKGLPVPVLPDVTLWSKMIAEVIPISVVAYSTNLSLGKLFAFKNNYQIDAMQEALAIGIANICSAFFSSIPGAASLSRSSLQEASGGRTQLAGIMSCIVILIFLLVAGPYFSVIPKALLASVIAVNLRGMFIQFHALPELWKFSKVDFGVWVGSFISVLVFGIDLGLGLAILILLLSVVVRKTDVVVAELGTTPEGDIFRETEQYESLNVSEYPIYKLPGSLDFASAEKVLVALPRRGQMLLDFSEVSYIDCVGRNTLEAVIKHIDFVGFCCVSEKTMNLLNISGISEEVNVGIYPTLLDGLAMLKEKNELTTSSDLSRESDDSKL